MSNYGTDRENGGVYRIEDIMAEVFDPSTGRLLVSSNAVSSYNDYESNTIAPGASTDGYDVKNTGGFFSDLTTSTRTVVKNNSEDGEIIIHLNNDNVKPITIKANGALDLEGFPVTNIFIDTDISFGSSTIEVTLFG